MSDTPEAVSVVTPPAVVSGPPKFKPGDPVLYVAHECHALDQALDENRQPRPVFNFEHQADKAAIIHYPAVRKGEPVNFDVPHKLVARNDQGHYMTDQGHVLRPVAPKAAWSGVVAAYLPAADRAAGKPVPVAVDAAGCVIPDAEGRVLIEASHPNGYSTLHYAVPYSAAKKPHTFHRQGD